MSEKKTGSTGIKITLEKTVAANEEDDLINESPHDTTVTGDEVEKYILRVAYEPDYSVTPIGQGGQSTADFHTGTFGTMYQGHAAGRESSTNTHIINVYSVPLDVYKTDGINQPLAGATFKLYKEDESGAAVAGLDSTKKYIEVAAANSGTDGIARLKHEGEDFGLVFGENYYLIETQAPENYSKDSTVWEVEVQTEIGKFTDLEGNILYSTITPDSTVTPPVVVDTGVMDSMYPFNWDQGARIMLDGKDPVLVIAKGDTEGSTVQITDGSFVSHSKAISFRHTVLNLIGGTVDIDVEKTWDDNNNPNRPSSVKVTLYRVSEKDHVWGDGVVVPSTCTAAGNKQYTCSECGETKTEVISAAGHTAGEAHHENETAPTCTEAGGYDTVVRCTACNAIISSEHTTIDALGHVSGDTVQENYVEPTYTAVGGYDEVVYCTRCGEEISRNHVEIPMLVNPEHTVTIYFRYTGNGRGGTDYPGQIQSITSRSGTGAGDMTIQWDWNRWTEDQPFDVDGLVGGSSYSTYSTSGINSNTYSRRWENNRWVERGKRQTVTISNITQDMTLYITIRNGGYSGTENGLIYQPTFAGVTTNSTMSTRQSMRRSLSKSSTSLRGESNSSATTIPDILSGISGLKSKNSAACGEQYWEEVAGTHTISGSNWTLSISDLAQYNEYGKPYTYYVEETPVNGYETTYSGQESGLTSGTVTITNKLKTVELPVSKTWAFATPSRVTKVEGKDWPQDVTVHVVVYSKTGDSEPVPTTYTVDLTADQTSYTFTGLPMYAADGVTEIEYSVVEAGVSGVDSTNFTTTISGDATSGYTITNTEKPSTKDFSFTKIWRDPLGNNPFEWPSDKSITVTIKQDSEDYAEYTISNSDLTVGTEISANGEDSDEKAQLIVTSADPSTGYVFTLTGLPYGDTEDGYSYTVSEETVDGYQSPKYFVGETQQMGASQVGSGGIIYNDQIGYELPSTGGPGTTALYLFGSILILGAGVLLWRRRRLI